MIYNLMNEALIDIKSKKQEILTGSSKLDLKKK